MTDFFLKKKLVVLLHPQSCWFNLNIIGKIFNLKVISKLFEEKIKKKVNLMFIRNPF